MHASSRISVMVLRTADRVLLTLLKTRSGSAVLDGSVDRMRSRMFMFGKNSDGHSLSALTAVVHWAFSVAFAHFCDHRLNSASTTTGVSRNSAYLSTDTLIDSSARAELVSGQPRRKFGVDEVQNDHQCHW